MTERRSAHPYHMHDAIHAQPERVARLLESRRELIERAGHAAAARHRILFVGIGTSYHAAQIAELTLRYVTAGQARAGIEQSFELVNYPLALGPDDAVVAISHRGWKNYSVQAVQQAKRAGALTIAVTGEEGGDGIRAAEFVIPTCEQEISFAHTKSYTTALAALAALCIRIAEQRGFTNQAAEERAQLQAVVEKMRQALACELQAREIAREIAQRERWVFVGAGPNWATAREGALKVKETSYIAAEGFQTEQFLHGPLAEVDSRAALTVHLTGGPGDTRAASVLRAAGELGIQRIAVASSSAAGEVPAEHRIEVPAVAEWLTPFVHVVPTQLLSYYAALQRGTNPDTGREDQPAHARAREHYKL